MGKVWRAPFAFSLSLPYQSRMTRKLTDRRRLMAARARARRADPPELHVALRDDLLERLEAVNKTFTEPAVVSAFPEVWTDVLPHARLLPDDTMLDLVAGAHDLVLHAGVLHWSDDPVGQLIQCRRALRPDGLFLAAAPGGRTLQELRTVLAEVEARIRGGLSPRVAPMADVREFGAALQRAGFALPVADVEAFALTYPDVRSLLHDVRAMGESNALAARDLTPLNRKFFDLVGQTYTRDHTTADGRVAATLEIIHLAGWAPHASQPRPLKPGSAQHRLADALVMKDPPVQDTGFGRAD